MKNGEILWKQKCIYFTSLILIQDYIQNMFNHINTLLNKN